jgi:hypothetical protein
VNKSNIDKITAIKLQVINHSFKMNAFYNNIDNKELDFVTKLREEQIQQIFTNVLFKKSVFPATALSLQRT